MYYRVVVATIIHSIFFISKFDDKIASWAASIARLDVSSCLLAICLCFIPVLENIHSSDVSTILLKSSLE